MIVWEEIYFEYTRKWIKYKEQQLRKIIRNCYPISTYAETRDNTHLLYDWQFKCYKYWIHYIIKNDWLFEKKFILNIQENE